MTMDLGFVLNGRPVRQTVAPEELLLDVLRERFGLTGVKRSCEVQVCGTCTVLLDGAAVSSCCTLAAEAEGRDVLTIEGLAELPEFATLESAFTRHSALQCGFCTPGMLLTVSSLRASGRLGDEAGVREALAGNLCRCTGYRSIVDAVLDLAQEPA